jgi:hypothetical protein
MEPSGDHQHHQQHASDDTDRRNHFLFPRATETLRERAASQPPRTGDQDPLSSSPQQPHPLGSAHSSGSNSSAGTTAPGASSSASSNAIATGRPPWMPRTSSGLNPHSALPGQPASVPTRSSSFSASPRTHAPMAAPFGATFLEDDEADAYHHHRNGEGDDEGDEEYDYDYDGRYLPALPPARGRTWAADATRSRSQSLAAGPRQPPIGSPLQQWAARDAAAAAMNIPGARYGDYQQQAAHHGSHSRYGTNNGGGGGNSNGGGQLGRPDDITNISPFVRDVGQILLDDGSAFRELWAGMHPPGGGGGGGPGGGSGTTSRRHSVSVVQPRRNTVVAGFSAGGVDAGGDDPGRPAAGPGFRTGGAFARGALMLSDEDLAGDLGLLNLHDAGPPPPARAPAQGRLPPSQPASLPVYAPLARSPSSPERRSPYQPLSIATSFSSASARRQVGSPAEDEYEYEYFDAPGPGAYGRSPDARRPTIATSGSGSSGARYAQQGMPTPTDILSPSLSRPSFSQGSAGGAGLPMSPGGSSARAQAPYSPQMTRRPSDAGAGAPGLDGIGRGVPLSAVPASWPLYIVEFKAGRTDLFYCTNLSLEIRVGDLVIVEADRGKDLGKVVNDTITLAEVEEYQKQQAARVGVYGAEGQPAGAGGKEISPKMIYSKAGPQDTA